MEQARITRLATLIHHITTLCDPSDLGRTKIAKILWLADVEAYRRTGELVTGSDDYVKDRHGPRHRDLYDAIDLLIRERKADKRIAPTYAGPRHELLPIGNPDVSEFTAEQIATVDRVTAYVSKLTAKEASDLTHDDVWESANYNEKIPVASVAPIQGEMTPEIMAWAESIFDNEHRASGERIQDY
jgi:hypothetical protein